LWNSYGSPASLAASDSILRERCLEAGRDQSEIERTVNLNVVVRPTRAEAEGVWASYAAEHRPKDGEGRILLGGPVEEVAAEIAEYVRVGFRHPILIFRTPWDLETINALGAIRERIAAGG
jgi:alkanesulfonate monooxygenase SsuD/methylene tetrahydromethanopterin reductase-like flavin-dependent oxidoreductase (luciferase family)